ncbi:RsmB/NOP family class I SAM-dependent RNA methyltransferase [Rhodobaculum claviforme]|uniref:16S rRNA methyltransferase n=1 Tax=Rhodobaculum claviforme TaxID=1549854 RepID=A0A934TJ28_9RHOB|nr:RsmB/NOP family class I SAM-dependent RNA methyltransferase [Rhodobaculum claviforme]MBK5927004.1 16S rRNA methyltransferase [Rhodobaculum claviforme]
MARTGRTERSGSAGRTATSAAPVTARGAAARLLEQVLRDHRPLEAEDSAGPLAPLPPADRARALRLARTTLRHLGRADATLAPYLSSAPPDAVRMLLRLAVVEHFVEGAPAHAVVNEAVEQVRARRGGARLAGMANAVLRRALATPPQDWAARPPERLPDWLRKRLVRAWGAAAVAAMEEAHAQGAPTDLTPRAPGDAAALSAALGATLLPTGSLRLGRGAGQISTLPGHAEGAFWIQDAAAALPARLLAPRAGARVLDLCAAPGGKTLQLAATGAAVTALDISDMRLARLHENLGRVGLPAQVVTADALTWTPEAPFDAILLDAPCTATGTIRRHPDLPHVRGADALRSLVAVQAALIDRALGWLAPGGRLVYATCSLLPEEGEDQIAAALARHPGVVVLPVDVPGADPDWSAPGGGLRLRPDHWAAWGGIDGFFMAALHRPGAGHDIAPQPR